MSSSLTALQTRALALLAGMDPPWTLSGGGALAGFHLGHRTTRDLDLFWHGQGRQILVDTRHEILVNKLTTLLSRSELRDLVDLKALIEAGGDLERGIRDAPKKDGGFSGPTLAWLLGQLPMERLGAAPDLITFRDSLVKRFLAGPSA